MSEPQLFASTCTWNGVLVLQNSWPIYLCESWLSRCGSWLRLFDIIIDYVNPDKVIFSTLETVRIEILGDAGLKSLPGQD